MNYVFLISKVPFVNLLTPKFPNSSHLPNLLNIKSCYLVLRQTAAVFFYSFRPNKLGFSPFLQIIPSSSIPLFL